jgi:hypothetical protein
MKGLLYYTDNQCQERILLACRIQLNRCQKDYPLVSVSQYPIDFGKNIVLPLNHSIISMFKQIVAGLEALDTEVVFLVEHDVLYHPSHFDFNPPKDNVYFYNTNVWTVRSDTGQALYVDYARRTSGLVAHREILLEHYQKKIKLAKDFWESGQTRGFPRLIGYEPGRKKGRDDYEYAEYKSEQPNLDIKYGRLISAKRGVAWGNITKPRFKLSEYQHGGRRVKDSWKLTYDVPYWGRTKNFDDFLRSIWWN